MKPNRLAAACVLLVAVLGCAPPSGAPSGRTEGEPVMAEDILTRLARFAPTELRADLSDLAEEDRQVLAELVTAARLMDEIFLRQVWTGNPDLRARLDTLAGPPGEAARSYFRVNFGPWDRLDEMEAFLGERAHPSGAGYYPEDLTKEEFEGWLADHPGDEAAFTSLTTVVRRQDPDLAAVPYSSAYREWLEPAAAALRRAAAATGNESLRRFLESRADAFLSDDYYESDVAWMDLDSTVEVTIGPYETYEDGLFGYKAAFEAFVTVASAEESARLERFKALLPWLEGNLPIPEEHKNRDRGSESPIRVVDVLFVGGDSKAGVQTLAFNLPNDERVREEKGSKKVLLRNVLRAKYDQILGPIADRVLPPAEADKVSFDAYMAEVLHHELSHGLGPGKIHLDGRDTEVRLELKELYSTMEEAKADVMGIYDILALIRKGEIPPEVRTSLEPTYVAGLFRAARFGVHEAHGRGVVSQFNYLLERGALEVDDEGRFQPVSERFEGAIEELLTELVMLQAKGDYDGTAEFLNTYGVASDSLLAAIDLLDDVPVDIRPVYPQAEELAPTG
jgi:hypothetical protein